MDEIEVTGAAGTVIDDNGHYNGDGGTAEDVEVKFPWGDDDITDDNDNNIDDFDEVDFNMGDFEVTINGEPFGGGTAGITENISNSVASLQRELMFFVYQKIILDEVTVFLSLESSIGATIEIHVWDENDIEIGRSESITLTAIENHIPLGIIIPGPAVVDGENTAEYILGRDIVPASVQLRYIFYGFDAHPYPIHSTPQDQLTVTGHLYGGYLTLTNNYPYF